MAVLYNFPSQAAFGKVIPKSRIYEHTSPSARLKGLFVKEIEKIKWSYKLAPETINLPERNGIREIQVLTLSLKTGTLHHELLQVIDRAIPTPILFHLSFQSQSRYVAAYKRPSEADSSKTVISGYSETDWIDDSADRADLPVAIDMAGLYRELLENVISLSTRHGESLSDFVARAERLHAMRREADRLSKRIEQEKQFNRKVELNRRFKKIRKEMETINQ